jgi:L-seryl-tRNA(Ser) seleniumtransferase
MSRSSVSAYRSLPSVDELLRSDTGRAIAQKAGLKRSTELARQVISELRRQIRDGQTRLHSEKEELLVDAESKLNERWQRSLNAGLRRVINATGVIIHTNLGRSPLSETARQKVLEAAGYCNLEFDLETGLRGRRGQRVETLVCELTGSDDALVVNNCAAAAFLVLMVLAPGREAIISRGELVEIGGDFRVPDVLLRAGVTLREVGTTNRTKLADYEAAINEKTAMILRVHPSNYRIVGFTAVPTLAALADLAHERNIVLYEDAGSGLISDLTDAGLAGEPLIGCSLADGADIITFSGDKLLGGPQAGIIVGRGGLIDRLRNDPLYRALRVDKLTCAALEATLEALERGAEIAEIPTVKMLAESKENIEERARSILEGLKNSRLVAELVEGNSAVGGGAAPLTQPETTLIVVRDHSRSASELAQLLRESDPPIIARISDENAVIDLRTVGIEEESELLAALNSL